MLRKGLIQVYTGNGDHAHFAPLGLGLRATGQNLKTHMTYFLPHQWMEGVHMASILLKPNLLIEHTQLQKRPQEGKWNKSEINEVLQTLQQVKKAMLNGTYDIVILNDINLLCNQGIIPVDEILELMNQKPEHVELVLSGHGASEAVLAKADLITEVACHVLKDEDRADTGQVMGAPTEIVTGNGKGKTTYCLGKALLMSCMGVRSTILQFIKSRKPYGEVKAIEKLPYLEIKSMGEGFLDVSTSTPDRKHSEAAKRAWENCLREIFSLKYGLIILDEINIATYYGLVHVERVREMIFLKPERLHLILSGRNAHLELREGASSVIEMREIKHPFHKGITARKGIEF